MIDISKKYKTRDGRPVRLISDQGSSTFPIIGIIQYDSTPSSWTKDGITASEDGFCNEDLIEVKPEPRKTKVSGWVNVQEDSRSPGPYIAGSHFATKEEADRCRTRLCIACKYIEFEVEEGEGL